MSKITVYHYKGSVPLPLKVEVNDDMESLKKLVGGWLEPLYMWPSGLVLICDEEGKLKKDNEAHFLAATRSAGLVAVRGDFFVCRHKGGSFVSVKTEDLPVLQREIISIAAVRRANPWLER